MIFVFYLRGYNMSQFFNFIDNLIHKHRGGGYPPSDEFFNRIDIELVQNYLSLPIHATNSDRVGQVLWTPETTEISKYRFQLEDRGKYFFLGQNLKESLLTNSLVSVTDGIFDAIWLNYLQNITGFKFNPLCTMGGISKDQVKLLSTAKTIIHFEDNDIAGRTQSKRLLSIQSKVIIVKMKKFKDIDETLRNNSINNRNKLINKLISDLTLGLRINYI